MALAKRPNEPIMTEREALDFRIDSLRLTIIDRDKIIAERDATIQDLKEQIKAPPPDYVSLLFAANEKHRKEYAKENQEVERLSNLEIALKKKIGELEKEVKEDEKTRKDRDAYLKMGDSMKRIAVLESERGDWVIRLERLNKELELATETVKQISTIHEKLLLEYASDKAKDALEWEEHNCYDA